MKPNEFRVGNLIYHNWVDKNGKNQSVINVIGTMNEFVIVDSNRLPEYEQIHIDDVVPILLNDEYLLKLGFKHHGTNEHPHVKISQDVYKKEIENDMYMYFVYETVGSETKINVYIGNIYIYFQNGASLSLKSIEYVHQLQNLYFELTGKDLILNG